VHLLAKGQRKHEKPGYQNHYWSIEPPSVDVLFVEQETSIFGYADFDLAKLDTRFG
jgi:hypothetical protein